VEFDRITNYSLILLLEQLSVSVHLEKNTVHPGDKQTMTLKVVDTNTTNAIAWAKVTGSVMNPSGSSIKSLDGTRIMVMKHHNRGL
jgi:hypothetical protein